MSDVSLIAFVLDFFIFSYLSYWITTKIKNRLYSVGILLLLFFIISIAPFSNLSMSIRVGVAILFGFLISIYKQRKPKHES